MSRRKTEPESIIIYRLHDPITGEARYVGQTMHFRNRISAYRRGIGSNPHHTNWLKYLKDQGLEPMVEVLYDVDTIDEADTLETAEIDVLRATIGEERCLNAANGGSVNRGFVHSNEWKNYLKERYKGGVPQCLTPEAIERAAEARRGIPRGEDTKAKIRAKRALQEITPEHKKAISASLTGRIRTPEERMILSDSATERAQRLGMDHLHTEKLNQSRSNIAKKDWKEGGKLRNRKVPDEEIKQRANEKKRISVEQKTAVKARRAEMIAHTLFAAVQGEYWLVEEMFFGTSPYEGMMSEWETLVPDYEKRGKKTSKTLKTQWEEGQYSNRAKTGPKKGAQ